VDFKAATDRAIGTCITLADIAGAAGVSDNAIRRARLDPDSGDSYRRPPEGWQSAIAKLARERAADLVRLADELEG
jgi:hypothetical protein